MPTRGGLAKLAEVYPRWRTCSTSEVEGEVASKSQGLENTQGGEASASWRTSLPAGGDFIKVPTELVYLIA